MINIRDKILKKVEGKLDENLFEQTILAYKNNNDHSVFYLHYKFKQNVYCLEYRKWDSLFDEKKYFYSDGVNLKYPSIDFFSPKIDMIEKMLTKNEADSFFKLVENMTFNITYPHVLTTGDLNYNLYIYNSLYEIELSYSTMQDSWKGLRELIDFCFLIISPPL